METRARCSELDVPGADPGDDVEPFEVVSTPGQVATAKAFFTAAKAAENSEQVKRARTLSRVFSLMQYRVHPDKGEVMLTQEQIDEGLAVLGDRLHRWAYVWHPHDRLVDVDEGTGEFTCTGLKGLHVHMVLWCKDDDGSRPTIRTVSDAFSIPSARVRVPKELAAQGEVEARKGSGAAEKCFFDLAEYLPHESRGKASIKGVTQAERFYLVDTSQDGNPGKYQYGRGRVVANFDFSAELDRHMVGRVSAAEGAGSLAARKRKLRRLVRLDGLSLDEARAKDFDAWADDLPRLRALRIDWMADPANKPKIGSVFTKGTVAICAPSGHGKGILADDTAAQVLVLATLAGGRNWTVAEPAGRNAIEDVGPAEVVIHDDARFWLLPTHDEFLRWMDPNRVTAAATRNVNTPAPAPRAILLTTSNTLEEFALTVFTRKPSEVLAESARFRSGATNIDELLRRIGWFVEIRTPSWVLEQEGRITKGEFLELIRDEMVVSVHRMRVVPKTVLRVLDREGAHLGAATTTREPELVAMIKGCGPASRFLAISLIEECSPDVWADLPIDAAQAINSERQGIHLAGLQRAAEAVAS